MPRRGASWGLFLWLSLLAALPLAALAFVQVSSDSCAVALGPQALALPRCPPTAKTLAQAKEGECGCLCTEHQDAASALAKGLSAAVPAAATAAAAAATAAERGRRLPLLAPFPQISCSRMAVRADCVHAPSGGGPGSPPHTRSLSGSMFGKHSTLPLPLMYEQAVCPCCCSCSTSSRHLRILRQPRSTIRWVAAHRSLLCIDAGHASRSGACSPMRRPSGEPAAMPLCSPSSCVCAGF